VINFHRLCLGVIALVIWALLPLSQALATSPGELGYCGGSNQRACCIFEAFPSCDPGNFEIPANNTCGIFNAGQCVPVTTCGGPGQRACCTGLLEFSNASGLCNSGAAPVPGCYGGECSCNDLARTRAIHSCVAVDSRCGGEGQRACCFAERIPSCDSGLVEQTDGWSADAYFAVSGDATCSLRSLTERSSGSCISTSPGAISEPGTGWTAPPPGQQRGILRGYVDMHVHLLAHLAHGKKAFVGDPAPIGADGKFYLDETDPAKNINNALSPAKDLALHKHSDHGLGRDTLGDGTGDGARSLFGAPYFTGWPKWSSTTHQQAYYKWLERAWRGGLRAMTLLAVTNEALCRSTNKEIADILMCANSMGPILDQIDAAWDFERFIDAHYGGPGNGWFRIVTTPAQARTAVAAGKLAVVLGIEVDNLFNCKEFGCAADFGLPQSRLAAYALTQPTTLEEAVQVIYDMGVRHVFPVHNFDNAFGAAATWQDAIGVGQAVSEFRWWELEDCGHGIGNYGFWIDSFVQALIDTLGFGGLTPPVPIDYVNGNLYPDYASCNRRGLNTTGTNNGPRLLRALMHKGMLIDIDHMSNKSLDATIALTKTAPGTAETPYPLLASHVQSFDMHEEVFDGNKGRHERMRTRAQLNSIALGGGMIAAMLKDDVQDTDFRGMKFTVPYTAGVGAPLADDCRHSSKSFALAYQYAADLMQAPVGFGSDFNGVAGHLGPRFGSEACGGWELVPEPERIEERVKQERANNRLQYPFTIEGFGTFAKQETGKKTFDYNVDGLAHVGLLPDLVADLRKIGLDEYYIDEIMCSAEKYIRVWERAEALANGTTVPDPFAEPWLCGVPPGTLPVTTASVVPPPFASGWNNTDVSVTLTAVDDTAIAQIDYSSTGAEVRTGSNPGAQVTLGYSTDGTTELSFFATDNQNNKETPVKKLTLKTDHVKPTIVGTGAPAANGDGWTNSSVTVSFTCNDALSGIETCTASQVLANDGNNQTVVGSAMDRASNVAETTVGPIRIDKTNPTISASGNPGPNADGWNNTDVTVKFTCGDALSGVKSCPAQQIFGASANSQSATGQAIDLAGNTATASVSSIKIDKTPPTIAAARAPLANAAGWKNSDVTVTYTCGDALSGVKTCPPQQVFGEGGNQTALGQALDYAGNTASASVSNINVDKTAPVVIVTGVAAGATYPFGAVPIAGCATSDALSGVAVQALLALAGGTSNGVGTFTASCTDAMDVAGNPGSASAQYFVRYAFTGLFSPVANPPALNTNTKAGQTVPLKFSLAGDFGLDVMQGVPSTSMNISCDTREAIGPEEVIIVAAGESALSYDAKAKQYQFNWKTETGWDNTCRRLLLRLDDGTTHVADFRFKPA